MWPIFSTSFGWSSDPTRKTGRWSSQQIEQLGSSELRETWPNSPITFFVSFLRGFIWNIDNQAWNNHTHTQRRQQFSSCGAVFRAWSFDVIEGQDVNRFCATKFSEDFDRERLLSTRDLGAHQHGQSQLPGSVYSEPYPVLEGLSPVVDYTQAAHVSN